MSKHTPFIAIVDYGLGNVFSVLRACEHVGLRAELTHDRNVLLAASAVILPGVGAFGDAMATLDRLDLISVIRDVAISGKPLMGICLGLQLLMSESHEFGRHRGLNLIAGDVIRLNPDKDSGLRLKVPQVGWNRISPLHGQSAATAWQGSLLSGITSEESMYFVHSFFVRPVQLETMLSQTHYGSNIFCSSIQHKNIFACQFHPERSGPAGLQIYRNLLSSVTTPSSQEGAYVEHVNR